MRSRTRTIVLDMCLYAALLVCMSAIQKMIVGVEVMAWKGYIFPFVFGGITGSTIGYFRYFRLLELDRIKQELDEKTQELAEKNLDLDWAYETIREENDMASQTLEELEAFEYRLFTLQRQLNEWKEGACEDPAALDFAGRLADLEGELGQFLRQQMAFQKNIQKNQNK